MTSLAPDVDRRSASTSQEKVQQYLQDSPKDLKKVVHQLEQETKKRVSTKTIKRLIKKNRYVWKRIRKAPAKSPDPHKYERSKVFMNQLQQREAVGECDLWYFDGTGFCLTPCIPYAWQPRGHTMEIPASSHSQRVNVLGFLKRNNEFVPYMIDGKVDAPVIVKCFDQFSQQLDKKTYVFMDNAPVHRSQAFIKQIPKWVKQGLIVKYLPSYSPELNLIENWWCFMKYYWLPFSAYASFQCLSEAVERFSYVLVRTIRSIFRQRRICKHCVHLSKHGCCYVVVPYSAQSPAKSQAFYDVLLAMAPGKIRWRCPPTVARPPPPRPGAGLSLTHQRRETGPVAWQRRRSVADGLQTALRTAGCAPCRSVAPRSIMA